MVMFKRLLGCFIFLTALNAHAFQTLSGNIYVAADAGIFRANYNTYYNDQTDVISQSIAETVSQNGYVGGLAIGYNQLYNDAYSLGIEFSGHLATNDARYSAGASTAAFSDKTKINSYFDLVFVPGVMLTETLNAYLKLGLSLAHVSDDLSTPVGFTPTYASYSSAKNVGGFAAAIGVKKQISQQLFLYTEYSYHDYRDVDFDDFQNFTASYSHSADITSSALSVGVLYNI